MFFRVVYFSVVGWKCLCAAHERTPPVLGLSSIVTFDRRSILWPIFDSHLSVYGSCFSHFFPRLFFINRSTRPVRFQRRSPIVISSEIVIIRAFFSGNYLPYKSMKRPDIWPAQFNQTKQLLRQIDMEYIYFLRLRFMYRSGLGSVEAR